MTVTFTLLFDVKFHMFLMIGALDFANRLEATRLLNTSERQGFQNELEWSST